MSKHTSLKRVPVSLGEAKAFVQSHHRHHKAPVGWKFGCGVSLEGATVGVVVAGRPVSRMIARNPAVLEITRCCVLPSEHKLYENACSMLYGAICRAAFALGYERVITYTLGSESGSSLKAAGFTLVATTSGGEWSRDSRPRRDADNAEPKNRWERAA